LEHVRISKTKAKFFSTILFINALDMLSNVSKLPWNPMLQQ
jgi:hypothetical protein